MSSNESDNQSVEYVVAMNAAGYYALLPSEEPIPPGWVPLGPPRVYLEGLGWMLANWPEMSPRAGLLLYP